MKTQQQQPGQYQQPTTTATKRDEHGDDVNHVIHFEARGTRKNRFYCQLR